MVNIVVAFPKVEDAKNIRNILARNGYTVAGVCTSAGQVLSLVDNLGETIVVCGYRLQDTMSLNLKDGLPSGVEMVLITSPMHQDECRGTGVVCLTMPLKTQDMLNTIEMLSTNLLRLRKKRKQQPKQRNEKERKLIDDAKAILMEKHNMDEGEAHRYLQKNSMDSGVNMVEYAKMVLQIMYRE